MNGPRWQVVATYIGFNRLMDEEIEQAVGRRLDFAGCGGERDVGFRYHERDAADRAKSRILGAKIRGVKVEICDSFS